jgi:hypothetical protein
MLCVFCRQRDSMQRIFIKRYFLFMVGSVCRVKRFTTGSRNSLKDIRKSQMMPDQVRKCLEQQPKDFYAAGFDALVKRWDKCISVGGGYVERKMFFCSSFEYHVICVLYPFVTYLLTLPYALLGSTVSMDLGLIYDRFSVQCFCLPFTPICSFRLS